MILYVYNEEFKGEMFVMKKGTVHCSIITKFMIACIANSNEKGMLRFGVVMVYIAIMTESEPLPHT